MAYLVLARKYRPQSWESLVGQSHVSATLKNAIEHERLAHAYLFTGPRGVGKTSAARILAKALNCENGPAPEPCNACTNCTEIAEGRSVDVFEIDGASNRGIDEVRNLRENIKYTPVHGKYRIYIIDEVHMLTSEAFNALLKTLEEPPSHVLFIFATTEPHRVPSTIMSRCQRFDFRRIGVKEISSHLKKICEQESIRIDDDALMMIAKKADGGLRDSQSILDQMISFTGEHITAEDVVKALGIIEQDVFFEVTDVVLEKDVQKGLDLVDRIVSAGYDMAEFMEGIISHFRNLLVAVSCNSPELLEVTETVRERYKTLVPKFKEEDILRYIRIVTDASATLRYSHHPRIPLELSIVKMIKMDHSVTFDQLIEQIHSIRGQSPVQQRPSAPPPQAQRNITVQESTPVKSESDPAPQSRQETTPIPQQTPPAVSSDEGGVINIRTVQNQWEKVIAEVKSEKITVGSFLLEGAPCRVNGNTIEIGFAASNGFHIDAIMKCKGIVTDALKKVFGMDLNFRCIKGELPPAPNPAQIEKDNRPKDIKSLGAENEVVQKLMDDFDVELTD